MTDPEEYNAKKWTVLLPNGQNVDVAEIFMHKEYKEHSDNASDIGYVRVMSYQECIILLYILGLTNKEISLRYPKSSSQLLKRINIFWLVVEQLTGALCVN